MTICAGAFVAVVSTMAAPVVAQASTAGGSITRSEIIQRAHNWYTRSPQLSYNQGAEALDVDGQHWYRTDCSGFVSMALHLTSDPNTAGLPAYATAISWSALRPGDFLDIH